MTHSDPTAALLTQPLGRRHFLAAAAAFAAAAPTLRAAAPGGPGAPDPDQHGAHSTGDDHDHHHHHHLPAAPAALLAASLSCIQAGAACEGHCLQAFGDTSLANCAARVHQMSALCGAVLRVASVPTPHLKDLVAVCAKFCQDCETACREHADTHPECKACAESCARFVQVAASL